jgi:hypothetical protein
VGGNNWQEKSFSVAVSNGKADCQCVKCKIGTAGEYKYNGDMLCKECFSGSFKLKSAGLGFNTDKDLRYNFVTDMFDGKPVQINSKRQFRQLIKQYGLMDASIKEVRQHAEFRKRVNAESDTFNRKKFADKIMSKYRDRLKFRRY